MAHRVGGPRGIFIGVTRSTRIRNLVLVRHPGSDEPERMRVNKGAGRSFSFDCRHVTRDALATRSAILVVRVLFDRGCAGAVR